MIVKIQDEILTAANQATKIVVLTLLRKVLYVYNCVYQIM